MSNTTSLDNLEHSAIDKDLKPFKIVLVGDGGTGKSSFVDRLNDGGYRKEYVATIGFEEHKIQASTSVGNIEIIIYDTAGQENSGPLRDHYYKGADAAILFFDVTSRITYKNIPQWHKDITRVCSNIPIALCANKVDIESSFRKVKSKNILYHTKYDMGFFEISVKEQLRLKDPVEYILQKLLKDDALKITESLGTLIYENFNSLNL
ncbi:UNVERIFIED_CONTAM: hypothetical protein GTU68_017289 [Idotea baltica]|nr:hypothetical protein [Idotea baltica]